MKGFYMKYILGKSDGTMVDPEACYFVLRLDTDRAARAAIRAYAASTENEELAKGILACVDWLDNPPECICGGRDRGIVCPRCDGGLSGHPVWRHGGDK